MTIPSTVLTSKLSYKVKLLQVSNSRLDYLKSRDKVKLLSTLKISGTGSDTKESSYWIMVTSIERKIH